METWAHSQEIYDLRVTGAVATDWMAIVQCFAGPPEDPPAPGTRFTRAGCF
jgi:hypothetical protein